MRVRMAITLQLDAASMKLINATTKAAGSKARIAAHPKSGAASEGNPAGTSPTTRPPRSANPSR